MTNGEAFSRVKIDAQLKDAGWKLIDGRSVRFEHGLGDGTKADYVLCDRRGQALAVLEAKRASVSLGAAEPQALAYAVGLGVPFVFLTGSIRCRKPLGEQMRKASVTWLGALVGLGLGAATGQPALAAENLRLCTGSPGKAYIKVGQKLADLALQLTAGALTIEVVPTAGSLDNLAKAVAGECDAFISQGDAIDFFTRQLHPEAKDSFQVVGELYKELTLLLCRRDSGIDDLDEAQGQVVAAGSMGTGSLATLLNLQQLAPDSYGEIKINPTNGFEGAMAVVNGQAQCLLDVIAPQSDLVKTLNDNERTGMQLYFAEIDNDDLEDYEVAGSKVYSLVEFDDEVYPNLSTTGDPEMLAISAVLALPRAYAQAHPQAVSALAMLLLTGGKDIEREAYGETKPFAE